MDSAHCFSISLLIHRDSNGERQFVRLVFLIALIKCALLLLLLEHTWRAIKGIH